MDIEYPTKTNAKRQKTLFPNANDIISHIQVEIKGQKVRCSKQINLTSVLRLHKLNPNLTIPKDLQQYIALFQQYARFDVPLGEQASRAFFQKNYKLIFTRFLQCYCFLQQSQIKQIDEEKTITDWMDWLEKNVVFKNPHVIRLSETIFNVQPKLPILKNLPSKQDLQKEYKEDMARKKEQIQLKKQAKNTKKTSKRASKQSQEKISEQKIILQTKKRPSRQKKTQEKIQQKNEPNAVPNRRGRKKKTQQKIQRYKQKQDENQAQYSSLSIHSSQIERLRLQSSQQKNQFENMQPSQDNVHANGTNSNGINSNGKIEKIQVQHIVQEVIQSVQSVSKDTLNKTNDNKLNESVMQIQKPVQIIEISKEELQPNELQLRLNHQSTISRVENARQNRFKREMQEQNSLSRGRFLLSTTPPFNMKSKRKSKSFDLNSSLELERQVQVGEGEKDERDSSLRIKYSPSMFNTMKRLSACLANQELRYYIMPQMRGYR